MKRYRVNVNGNDYEIGIELLDEAACTVEQTNTPKRPAPVSSGATSITSPMPGTILSINFNQGANVKKGDVIMILEAMKMENEILAPCDGKILTLSVSKGATVESGSLLCTLG